MSNLTLVTRVSMDDDVSRLEALHGQLRTVRALLPQMVHRLAFVSDDSDSSALFKSVASDLTEWQTSIEQFEEQYSELKPLINELTMKTEELQ